MADRAPTFALPDVLARCRRFFALALGGVPLVYALLATTVGMIWAYGLSHPLETIFLSFIGGVEPFILIAVPLFMFAGELLSHGGVGRRIVDFAQCAASACCRAAWASSPSLRA